MLFHFNGISQLSHTSHIYVKRIVIGSIIRIVIGSVIL